MEAICVIITIADALDGTVFLAVDLSETTGNTFSRSSKQREVEVILLHIHITTLAHMSNDVKTEFARILIFAMVLTGHGD